MVLLLPLQSMDVDAVNVGTVGLVQLIHVTEGVGKLEGCIGIAVLLELSCIQLAGLLMAARSAIEVPVKVPLYFAFANSGPGAGYNEMQFTPFSKSVGMAESDVAHKVLLLPVAGFHVVTGSYFDEL